MNWNREEIVICFYQFPCCNYLCTNIDDSGHNSQSLAFLLSSWAIAELFHVQLYLFSFCFYFIVLFLLIICYISILVLISLVPQSWNSIKYLLLWSVRMVLILFLSGVSKYENLVFPMGWSVEIETELFVRYQYTTRIAIKTV